MGRKRIYGVTLKLMVVCSLASGLSFHDKPKCVVGTSCFFRFWLGFGVGGNYPLSKTVMSEYANKRTRGAFIAAVFAMQGLGNLAAGAVVLVLSARFKNTGAYETDPFGQADYVWRIVLILGAVPTIVAGNGERGSDPRTGIVDPDRGSGSTCGTTRCDVRDATPYARIRSPFSRPRILDLDSKFHSQSPMGNGRIDSWRCRDLPGARSPSRPPSTRVNVVPGGPLPGAPYPASAVPHPKAGLQYSMQPTRQAATAVGVVAEVAPKC